MPGICKPTRPATPTLMNCAAAGLAFLEQWGTPKGRGLDAIDLARLNMDSTIDDIFGQLFGLYDDGYDLLGLTPELAVRLGFDCAPEDAPELTNCWRILLTLRRNRLARKAA